MPLDRVPYVARSFSFVVPRNQAPFVPQNQAPTSLSLPNALGREIGQTLGDQFIHQLPAVALRSNTPRAYGLKGLGELKGSNAPTYNKQFSLADKGQMFGEKYVIVGAKPQGVEPGFTAKKAWTDRDTEKMLGMQGEHKYMDGALGALLASMSDSELIALAEKNDRVAGAHPSLLRQELQDPNNAGGRKVFLEPMLQTLREDFLTAKADQKPLSFDHAKHIGAMSAHIKATVGQQKFEKLHYMKLDYSLRTTPFSKTYIRPARKNVGFVKRVKDFFVRWWKADKPKGLNEAAVKECLANDLTRAFGVNTQKLKLVESRYPTGETKWMLDGTHVTGQDPTQKYADLDRSMSGHGDQQVLVETEMKDGKSVRKCKLVDVPGRGMTTIYRADTGIKDLGEKKILFMLMGDVDAVGSRGQNKGRIGDDFVAIDPGHSLSTSAMKKHNIRNDFSISNQASYRNFSIFDQTPYSERMKGVQKIKALRQAGSEWEGIFSEYKGQFGVDKDINSNFADSIQAWQSGFESRADYIVDTVFKDRLAVYDFDMDAADPVEKDTAHAQVLDMLDTFEKITSEHTWTQSWTDKEGQHHQVDLAVPLVRADARQEWRVSEDTASGELVFQAVHPKKDLLERWTNFKNSAESFPVASVSANSTSEFEVRIAKKDVAEAAKVFNLAKLRQIIMPRVISA